MSLPASVTTVTVHADATMDLDGEAIPAGGKVVCTPSVDTLIADGDSTIVLKRAFVADLDASGGWTLDLPATDDPDLSPSGWHYTVILQIPGRATRTWYLQVPYDTPGGDLDATGVLAVDTPDGLASYVTQTTVAAAVTAHVAAVDPHGDRAYADGLDAAMDARVDALEATAAGLGGAAVLDVGTAAGTVAAGDDSRLPYTPKLFGAIGDGVTDDTAALQDAIDSAWSDGVPLVFPAKTYVTESALLVHSGQSIRGIRGKTIVKQVTAGQAVMASHNYISGNPGPSGYMDISDIVLQGESTDPSSHGLIFRDYLSRISGVIFTSCGGDGFHATHLDSSGSPYGGSSLVDNRIVGVDARNCHGYGLFIGELDNNKFTDLYLSHVYVSNGSGSDGAIYAGSTGGWKLNQVHTYGETCSTMVELNNPNHTEISGLYVEAAWTDSGVKLGKVQRAVQLDGIGIKCGSTPSSSALNIASKSSAVTEAEVSVGSLTISQDNTVAVNGVYLATSSISVAIGNLQVCGTGASSVTRFAGTGAASILGLKNARVDGALRDSAGGYAMTYKGIPTGTVNRSFFAGNSPQSLTLLLPAFGNYQRVHGTVSVVASRNYNGSLACRWRADVLITSKNNASDAWSVYVVDIISATGFDTTPTVTVDKATSVMTVSFTQTQADGYGVASLSLECA